jgi:hypothetical protein
MLTMRFLNRHLGLSIFQPKIALSVRLLGAALVIFMLQACGSGSNVLSGVPASSAPNANGTTSIIGTTSIEGGKAGTSTAQVTGTGTGANINSSTSTSNVIPSFVTDPAGAVQRVNLTTTLLQGFQKFFANLFGSATPTTSKDGDFRYLDCNGLRICSGSVSLTRTFKTLGTDNSITPGTAYAWYFQNYSSNGAGAIPTIDLNGTAYLAFPEGFNIGASTSEGVPYQGKATLYIKTRPPQTVIDFEGSINAINLITEGYSSLKSVGKLEITPNNQPTWMIEFDNWRAFRGPGTEGSKLTITESGQTAQLTVELAGGLETIYSMTYELKGQLTTIRIRKSWDTGIETFERL